MWDGSQAPFINPSPEDVLDGLTDHLLQAGDLNKALRTLMQRGMMNRQGQIMPGMQDILKQVRQTKEDLLQQYNPDGILTDLQRQLDDIVARERQALEDQMAATRQRASQIDDAAPDAARQRANEERAIQEMEEIVAERLETLDHLPPQDVGETIRRLTSYDFVDRQAKADFDALVQSLQQQAMESLFQMMKQRLRQLTPEDVQRLRRMIEDLNELLERQAMGEANDRDFQEFLERHRDLFPDGTPNSLDEFLEQMARQMEAMQALLNSMSEDMRQALQDLMQGQFDDAGMQQALAELMQHLQHTMEHHGLGNPFPFRGEESLSLQEALRLIERLQGLEALEDTLESVLWGGDPHQIDERQVQQLMDDATAAQVQALKEMAERLEAQGYLRKTGDRMELTARGVRKIAQRAMMDIFSTLRRDQMGRHRLPHRGAGGERLGATKPYAFGDAFDLDLPRTVMNAVIRTSKAPPLKLMPQDFETYQTESTSRCATVLLLDMSGSMERLNRFTAAKRVALALDAMIRSQFPRDTLAIVGFYTYAQEIDLQDLPYLSPKPFGFFPYMYSDMFHNPMGYLDLQIDATDAISERIDVPQAFTNIQAGLMVAERIFARQHTPNKQIVLITDGEPTAHIRDGKICLEYPPSQRTLLETLKEVKRCTRQGITINTFMLGQDYYMERFVDNLTSINRGRTFLTSPENIGDYILVDYLNHRRKKIA
jgi:uncharacterized protein with von Willebrand factor type A (vWA) domain